ncbi:hypothetical protein [Shewanella surugensis]|uniref:Cobalt transporter n=1 Tax=Shewanella surugensis TaxID=212020 RepID=A0ABT0L6C5_9GAMM|nr:hypothetical protein [Shewanella surugensis]MCL1122935.1 hypothetical protein [Shewanella surugensis]
MYHTKTSHRQATSKLTLSLVLLIFVCQIFASCVSAHNQYPQGEHSFDVMTCHFHNTNMSDLSLSNLSADDINAVDHEHDDHSHTSCHPPVEMKCITALPKSHSISGPTFAYQVHQYAPPVRPPHHTFSA